MSTDRFTTFRQAAVSSIGLGVVLHLEDDVDQLAASLLVEGCTLNELVLYGRFPVCPPENYAAKLDNAFANRLHLAPALKSFTISDFPECKTTALVANRSFNCNTM